MYVNAVKKASFLPRRKLLETGDKKLFPFIDGYLYTREEEKVYQTYKLDRFFLK